MIPRRGDVFLVRFDSTKGAEIRKTRPALVIQNDDANRTSPVTIVAALTSSIPERRYPTNVWIGAPEAGLKVDSVVLLNQIRTVDTHRMTKRLGRIRTQTQAQVDRALGISLGLVDYRPRDLGR